MSGAPAQEPASAGSARLARALPWLLFLLVFLLYLPSVRLGFVYDDETLIQKEARPDSWRDFTEIFDQRHFPSVPYYRPVTRLTFRLQHLLHGKNPAPFHLFNALLAGLAAAAAYGLIRRPAFGVKPVPAALAALLFAVHPAASSCVYPICSGRETLLPSLLLILAMTAWLGRGAGPRLLALGLWTLALFAREQAVVLPVLFLISDRLDLAGDGRFRRLLRLAGWYAAAAAILAGYLAVRLRIFGGSEFALALADHPWRPFLSYLYALQTAWAPFGALVYEPPESVWFSPWRAALAVLLTGALAAAGWKERTRLGRPLLFWAAWFFLIPLPTANLLRQEALFDERYAFLALLALPAALAALASLRWESAGFRRAAPVAGLLAAAALAGISASRAATFASDEAFSLQWTRANPDSAIALNNLGRARLDRGRYAEAEPLLLAALERGPGMAEIHFNLATVRLHRGRIAEALAGFEETLRLDPRFQAHYNRALALEAAGRGSEAEAAYRAALEREPGLASAVYNLGLLLGRTGRLEEAADFFRKAASLQPGDPDAPYNLGVTLERLERPEEAEAAYRQAAERMPPRADVHFNLGALLFRQGRHAEAVAAFEKAAVLAPDDAQIRRNLEEARRRLKSP